MIKLFRHIRKKLIDQTRVRKYFFYATGEIVLVVIGIMIALQVNNWNNNRAQDEETIAIFNQILDELIIDIEVLNDANQFYTFKDSLIEAYRKADLKEMKREGNDELDETDLIDMIRTFAPMEIHDRGFNLLMDHADQMDDRFKSYIDELVVIYQDIKPLLDLYNQRLLTLLYEHRKHKIENHAWYSKDRATNKRKQEEFEYYKYDPIYRNYVSFYNEMIYNIVVNSRMFEDLAIKFCRKLNTEFNLGRDIDQELSFLHPPKELLATIPGKYLTIGNDTLTFTIKNNLLYESTFDHKKIIYAFKNLLRIGELRYVGDRTFYRNPTNNLKVNSDNSLSLYHLGTREFRPLKRLSND